MNEFKTKNDISLELAKKVEKMKTEFSLSEKIGWYSLIEFKGGQAIPVQNIKEFIRLLKEGTPEYVSDPDVRFSRIALHRIIDKLVGDELSK